MNIQETLAKLFLKQPALVTSIETFSIGEWTFEGQKLEIPTRDHFLEGLKLLPQRDKIIISISIDSDPFSFSTTKPEAIDVFLNEGHTYIEAATESSIATIKITITKEVSENTVSLYSASAFTKTAKEKKLREQFKTFEAACTSDKCVWVQLFDNTAPFKTGTLIFSKTKPEIIPLISRGRIREYRDMLCNSAIMPLSVIPDDFHLNVTTSNNDLDALFNNLCVCACVLNLADISEFNSSGDGNTINFKLNGYKTITGAVHPEARPANAVHDWYKIYEWVYSEGGISDKLGIARNIMSLHWKGSMTDFVESGVLISIRSGYEIYLKRNVEQYIAVKNKLNDYLGDVLDKAHKLADGFADKFEKNVTAFVSFFITSILAKVLTDSSFVGVFNRPVAVIGLVIVAGSALHLILSIYVFNKDKEYIESETNSLKDRYSDLLDKAEIEKIFQKLSGISSISGHLKSKRNLFIGVWIGLLVTALILVLTLADWKNGSKAQPAKDSIIAPVQIQNTGTNK